ncbi:MAG: hypothetical protein AB7S26_09660 [Sandaracinaceae bacterium]
MIGPARVFALACLLPAAFAASGCDGSGPRADITFEFACPNDGTECIRAPAAEHCLSIAAFVVGANGERTRVRVYNSVPGDDVQPDAGYAEFRVMGRMTFQFDIDRIDEETPVDLEFRLYPDVSEAPVLGATVENVTRRLLRSEPLVVRLYPIGRWSDPGLGAPVPRALHEAVSLPSGDVLILGGVAGTRLNTGQDATVRPTLVYELELYEQATHRYVPVEADSSLSFGRVLFATRYLGHEDRGHRIRVIGGVTADPGQPVIRFDSRGVFNVGGAPVQPTDGTELGATVDLIVDTDGETPRLVAIEDVGNEGEPRGALVVVSEPQPNPSENPEENDATGVVLPQMVLRGASDPVPAPTAYRLGTRGEAVVPDYELAAPRVGATATQLATGDVFVWGGAAVADTVDLTTVAGELHVAGEQSALGTAEGAPPITGFHRAARVGDDFVLLVGGFQVVPGGGSVATSFLANELPLDPIQLLRITAGPRIVPWSTIGGDPYVSTILHALTPLDESHFLVTGGCTRLATDALTRFVAQDAAGIIDLGRYTAIPSLTQARFGHTATRLPGHRVLVHGGFASNDIGAVVNPNGDETPAPELIYLVDVDPADRLVAGQCMPQANAPDAGVRPDASLPPRGDAGAPDAGVLDGGALDGGEGGVPQDAGP